MFTPWHVQFQPRGAKQEDLWGSQQSFLPNKQALAQWERLRLKKRWRAIGKNIPCQPLDFTHTCTYTQMWTAVYMYKHMHTKQQETQDLETWLSCYSSIYWPWVITEFVIVWHSLPTSSPPSASQNYRYHHVIYKEFSCELRTKSQCLGQCWYGTCPLRTMGSLGI